MNPQHWGNIGGKAVRFDQQGTMASATNLSDSTGSWERFVGQWERANLIRSFFWDHDTLGNRTLLTHFLVRLRRFFGVDFGFGALLVDDEKSVEVGVPEAALSRLPEHLSRRCLEMVANSRAPITWNELNGEVGFRSTVVAPLAAPAGRAFGFVMLGHSNRRTYSSAELFILQALAGELSWAVRDLASRQQHQRQLAGLSHDLRNALQVIIANSAVIRQKLRGASTGEHEKHIANIETSVQEISQRMNRLPSLSVGDDGDSGSEEAVVDIAAAVREIVDSCRQTLTDRGVALEVTYAPKFSGDTMTNPAMFKRLLTTLVGNAALCARNETVQLAVQWETASVELAVKGTMATSKAAEKLKSLFESRGQLDGVQAEYGERVMRMREYLENAGGDIYLRSRPGEASEFVVCLPIDSRGPAVRSELTN